MQITQIFQQLHRLFNQIRTKSQNLWKSGFLLTRALFLLSILTRKRKRLVEHFSTTSILALLMFFLQDKITQFNNSVINYLDLTCPAELVDLMQ